VRCFVILFGFPRFEIGQHQAGIYFQLLHVISERHASSVNSLQPRCQLEARTTSLKMAYKSEGNQCVGTLGRKFKKLQDTTRNICRCT
jgi:hypothetical protein